MVYALCLLILFGKQKKTFNAGLFERLKGFKANNYMENYLQFMCSSAVCGSSKKGLIQLVFVLQAFFWISFSSIPAHHSLVKSHFSGI
jgi:hypothetical protein